MTLGQKIKLIRKKKKITQKELCADKITRNMLSAVECDKASPSISTLAHIAARLGTPVSYLLSCDDNLFFYEKEEAIEYIKSSFSAKKYAACINAIEKLSGIDDELSYMLAYSHFELGRKSVLRGSLLTAAKHLELSSKYCQSTIYDTSHIENLLLMFTALAKNIQSPLLEFDVKVFEDSQDTRYDYELYRYINADLEFQYKNPIFSKHSKALSLMKNRKYKEALVLLEEIINEKSPENYNSYVMFKVYGDMEQCSKQLANFEGAYKYSSKRMSMLEGFKS